MTAPTVLSVINSYRKTIPVDVFGLLNELGLGPDFVEVDDQISGWIERRSNGGYRVAINRKHSIPRQRFTAAHELGHYFFHRDLLGEGVGDTRAYRWEGSTRPNLAITLAHERQANTFAANLLMPSEAIADAKSKGLNTTEGLAKHFGVSEGAMRIRLGR